MALHAQAEIVDESDIYEDVDRRVLRRGGARADVAAFLAMFEHKLALSATLTAEELSAVAAFLSASVADFKRLACSEQALMVCFHLLAPGSYAPIGSHTISSMTVMPLDGLIHH